MSVKTLPKPINKKRFSFMQALYLAWYSGDLYWDVYANWRKHMLLFLYAVSFIIGIPIMYHIHISLTNYIKDEIVFPLRHLPKITIDSGKLKVTYTKPIFITNKTGKIAIIIDPENRIRSLPQKNYPNAFLLINQTQWSFMLTPKELSTTNSYIIKQAYTQRKLEIINNKNIIDDKFFSKAIFVINLTIIPSVAISLFSILLTFILFLSLISKFISSILFKIEITIKQSTRIMIISSIPSLWLLFIHSISPIQSTIYSTAVILLMPFYYNFAIYQIKKRLKSKTKGIISRLRNIK